MIFKSRQVVHRERFQKNILQGKLLGRLLCTSLIHQEKPRAMGEFQSRYPTEYKIFGQPTRLVGCDTIILS